MPSFACQRCRQALHLSLSLSDDTAAGGALTQSAYDVIEAESVLLRPHPIQHKNGVSTGTGKQGPPPDEELNFTSNRRESKDADTPAEPEVEGGSRNSLSSRSALTMSLFDLLSKTTPPSDWIPPNESPLKSISSNMTQNQRKKIARLPLGPNGMLTSAIDHPLCGECTNVLLSVMEAQLDEVRRERDAYMAFETELEKGEQEQEGREEISAEIEKLTLQAEETKAELEAAKREEAAVDAELRALDEEEKKLEEEEKTFWQSYTSLSREASTLSAQRSHLQGSLAHDRAQLHRLQQTNVYNDVFCIGYEDGYGTINGLRLGRLQNDSSARGGAVEWTEVNAAWGQTALLLFTLARKCNLTFKDYKIVPMGSFSTVEKIGGDRKEVYNLFGSSDWQLGRLLPDRRFDHGMIAFLDCLRQLCEHITTQDSNVKPPHIIYRDKIGGVSIRKSDEVWTRSLRNVLMTLKMLLSWVIKVSEEV
jgi:beclin 1